jgi:hypothetical protein
MCGVVCRRPPRLETLCERAHPWEMVCKLIGLLGALCELLLIGETFCELLILFETLRALLCKLPLCCRRVRWVPAGNIFCGSLRTRRLPPLCVMDRRLPLQLDRYFCLSESCSGRGVFHFGAG